MTRRLLLSYVALTVIVLVLLEVPLGVLEARQEHQALSATARRDATALAVLAADELRHHTDQDLVRLASRYREQSGTEVAVMDASGRLVVSLDPDESDRTSEFATDLRRALSGKGRTYRRTDEGEAQLVVESPVQASGEIYGAVAVAVPAEATDDRIVRAWIALAGLAVLLLAIAAGLGVLLARSLASPVIRLQDAAARLGGGDLEARAPGGGPLEIALLAEEFNRMADRLAGLVQGQRRFVADASHQLRTPLTSLRLRLENLAAAAPTDSAPGGQWAGDVVDCEADVDRLSRLVDGLLALSRAESRPSLDQPARAVEVLTERCAAWAALAEEQGVTVELTTGTLDPSICVTLAHELLEQVLDNLLANAVEASPGGSIIRVTADGSGDMIDIHVMDEGPGLSTDDRSRAFDRFWQGPNGTTGSAGLGLAIVHEVVTATHGTVALEPGRDSGLDVQLALCRA